MTVSPIDTWPSPAMTTWPPLRTQRMVVACQVFSQCSDSVKSVLLDICWGQECEKACPVQIRTEGRMVKGGDAASRLELGRASCRERVCQYVSISVVAVSLKTK